MGKYNAITRKEYEQHLNENTPAVDSDEWIIDGQNKSRCYPNYGTTIRRCDPIGFEVGFKDWARQFNKPIRA